MPELPDVENYLRCLRPRILGCALEGVRLQSAFVLRSVEPPLAAFEGREVIELSRLGKRIVLHFPEQHYLVLHLMIAGRLQWKKAGAAVPARLGLCAFDFPEGMLLFTEAGSKKRARLHAVRGTDELSAHDPGGLELFEADAKAFASALRAENHTLKRALTDPRVFSGIGNAYSDEILHRARMSPLQRTQNLDDDQCARLYEAALATLTHWTQLLAEEVGDGFPKKVTAFHPRMAVHGKYGEPCPDCAAPVQRIAYASKESNYCAACQTEGRLLRDRALSQLLKQDWPKSLEELEGSR